MGKGEAEDGWSTFACPKLITVRQTLLKFWFVALRVENLSIPTCSSCSQEHETASEFCMSGRTYQCFTHHNFSVFLQCLFLVDLIYTRVTVTPATLCFTQDTWIWKCKGSSPAKLGSTSQSFGSWHLLYPKHHLLSHYFQCRGTGSLHREFPPV